MQWSQSTTDQRHSAPGMRPFSVLLFRKYKLGSFEFLIALWIRARSRNVQVNVILILCIKSCFSKVSFDEGNHIM